jgi:hypothetical protein
MGKIEVKTPAYVGEEQLALSDDTSKSLICPIEISCYQLTDEKVKPLSLGRDYHGLVIVKANYNKQTLKLNKYEIIVTKLKDKVSNNSITLPNKELTKLLPVLNNHLAYIQLKKNNIKDCTEPSTFHLPVRIE